MTVKDDIGVVWVVGLSSVGDGVDLVNSVCEHNLVVLNSRISLDKLVTVAMVRIGVLVVELDFIV